ncbi:MAG: FtsX-like permease family protein [Chloroflexi bacterium]|nr:FtsX-like permease family protein [Chloroflexota bacterium]
MNVTWRKAWRDLAHNKLRTLLAVLSTAVGVFALGFVFGLSGVTRDRMTTNHQATIPAHINLWGRSFDHETIQAVMREPGVADAELEIYRVPFRWKLAGETEWHDGRLCARDDYAAQRMDLIDLLDGHWPVGRQLAVERQSSNFLGVSTGDVIIVEFGHGERELPVEGIVRSPRAYPPSFGADPIFYATPETVSWLTGRQGFGDVYIRLESFSEEGARETAERIKERMLRIYSYVGGPRITAPDAHWLQDRADTMFVILEILGGLSLGLSVFLIVNTTNAIVAQQVWQIGVMKVIGATAGRVTRMYLVTTLIYGGLASLLAIPLGAIGSHWLADRLLDLINVDAGPFQVTPTAVIVQIAVGLTVPVLAALVPVLGGARISPHRAIGSYGIGAGFGRGWLDRLVGRIRFLPRPMTLSLRNTFRRKARVVLTLLTLTMGGVIFIMVMSVGQSLNHTIDVLLQDFGDDVSVRFGRPYRVDRLIEVTEGVPGVVAAEVWERSGATLLQGNGEELPTYLWGVPPDSAMFSPRIVSGRALQTQDGRAILINHKIAVDEGIRVGDAITLTVGEQESAWTVVGLIRNINNDQRDNFAPVDALAQVMGNGSRGTRVQVLSEEHDIASHMALINDLHNTYDAHRIEATNFWSAGKVRERNKAQFDIITYLMLSMAILAAVVGSLGLMGTMTINVVERGREIGVMRATGATSPAIVGIFVGEGVLLGVSSWLFAVPLSYPSAQAFSKMVGKTLMQMPLDFSYSTGGVMLWLGIVVMLSTVASLWPALRAVRISVREALAYE